LFVFFMYFHLQGTTLTLQKYPLRNAGYSRPDF
jgi:hypothetical protein